jgi:hypothetical protein
LASTWYRQAAEIAVVSSNLETTAVCQDWMVELRGFEPMAIGHAEEFYKDWSDAG